MVVDCKRLAEGTGLKEQMGRDIGLGLEGILLGHIVEVVVIQDLHIEAVGHVGSLRLMEDHSRLELVHHM